MTKVKIFSGTDTFHLENEINEWLAKHEDAELLNVVNGSVNGAVIVSLFYQEPEPSRYDDENYDPSWGICL